MSKDDIHVLQDRSAGFVTRLFAFVIDLAVTAGILAVGGAIATLVDNAIALMGLDPRIDMTVIYFWMIPVIIGAYYTMFWSLTGRTIGKWFMGLKIIGVDGRPPTIGRALLRFLGYGISTIAFWAGFAWVVVDDERQGWHDHIARTWVVYDYARRKPGEIYDDFLHRSDATG